MDASGHAVKFNLSAVMFTTVVGVSVVVATVSVVVVIIGASVVTVEEDVGVGVGDEESFLPPLSANITIMITIPIITAEKVCDSSVTYIIALNFIL